MVYANFTVMSVYKLHLSINAYNFRENWGSLSFEDVDLFKLYFCRRNHVDTYTNTNQLVYVYDVVLNNILTGFPFANETI